MSQNKSSVPTIDAALEDEKLSGIADQMVKTTCDLFQGSMDEIDDTQEEKIARAATNMNALLDYIISIEEPATKRACMAGCSYCCHMPVSCSPIEAFQIVKYINDNFSPEVVRTIRDEIDKIVPEIKPLSRHEHVAKKIPCGMLTPDGNCSIYSVRPLNCRKWISFSKSECKAGYNAPNGIGRVGIDGKAFLRGTGIVTGLALSLKTIGVDYQEYEFHSLLQLAFNTPDGLQRWLKGENIFEGCRRPTSTFEDTND